MLYEAVRDNLATLLAGRPGDFSPLARSGGCFYPVAMVDFTSTGIWRRTLAEREADPHAKERERLRSQFLRFHDNAKDIAEEIKRAYPSLTVHGITHLDALWEVADIIAGPDYPLTPAEAFVLGGAFLVHDLGNGLAAYPGGESELRSSKAWKDALAARLRRETGRAPKASELEKPSPELAQLATEDALRVLHAKQAEKLVQISWKGPRGTPLYLIDDPSMRSHFGKLIGEISYSHWWDISEVAHRFARHELGPASFMPREWTVDALRVACLLRSSDAAHIDERRAPLFLMALRDPQGVSRDHWTFQRKLSKLHLPSGKDRLVYTSGEAFTRDEAESFWLCFDTLNMINRELRNVDAVLTEHQRHRLSARGVADADDARWLADHSVRTEGWTPIDARIHVSDLPSLVTRLGGAQLYGDEPTVPLRELLQNAADAIRARRALMGKPDSWGRITLRKGEDADGYWIEIEDTGLGMSERVLSQHLLDFGRSYWSTEDMRREHPGLAASTFQPTGRFGIGFFSVFMWGDRLRVTSRPYMEGGKTHVLEFNNGLRRRPLLRLAEPDEQLHEGGTLVRVWMTNKETWSKLFHDEGEHWVPASKRLSLVKLVRRIAPTLDVTVDVEKEPGRRIRAITANDWLQLDPVRLLERTDIADEDALKTLASRVLPILGANGQCVGRACLLDHFAPSMSKAVVTVGGLRAKGIYRLAGVFLGYTDVAARDEAKPLARPQGIAKWATQQGQAWEGFGDGVDKQNVGISILQLGGSPGDLPVLWLDGELSTLGMLEKWASERNELRLVINSIDRESQVTGAIVLPHRAYSSPPLLTKEYTKEYAKYERGALLFQQLLAVLARAWGVKPGQLLIEDRFGRWRWEQNDSGMRRLGVYSEKFLLRRPT